MKLTKFLKFEADPITKSYLQNLAYQLTSYIFPAIFVFLLPNFLSNNDFSILATLLSYFTIFSVVTDFGIDLYAPKKIQEANGDLKILNRLINSVFVFKFFLSIIVILILSYYLYFFYNLTFLKLLIIVAILPRSLNFYWWFLGNSNMLKFSFFTSFIWILFLISIFFLSLNEILNLTSISILFFCANLAISLYGVKSILRIKDINLFKNWKFDLIIIKESFPFFSSRLSSLAYTALGIPILSHLNLQNDVAIYSISEQLFRFAQSFIGPIVLSFYINFDPSRKIIIYKFLFYIIIFILLMYILAISTLPLVFDTFQINSLYKDAYVYFDYYTLALIVHLLASFFGFPLSNVYKNSNFANKSIIYSAILYIILASIVILLDIVNIKTLVFIMILSEFFLFVIRFIYFKLHKSHDE